MALGETGVRRGVIATIALALLTGCAGAPPGSSPAPAPEHPPAGGPSPAAPGPASTPAVVGEVFGLYRQGGLLTHAGPTLPFIGSVHFFAATSDDSTLVLVALSLANQSLAFSADGTNERAAFTVAIAVRDSAKVVTRSENQQVVRVTSFKETTRTDESVVYERYLTVPPGSYTVAVTVTDQGSANSGSAQIPVTVPRLGNATLSSPTTVHRAVPRARRDTLPDLIANPRSTLLFGRDSVAPMYLEAYGLAAGARIALSVLDADHAPLWGSTVTLTRPEAVAAAQFDLPIASIGLGRRIVVATIVGSRDTMTTPLWVTVGEGLGIVSYEELLNYLRYFATSERLQALRDTPMPQRAAAWAAFWKETDPNPATAENEALRDYFERIQVANQKFREQGEPGWLTDRGKVYSTLGEPDQVQGQGGRGLTVSGRSQYWAYASLSLRFEFVDQNGMGRWRLTPKSEGDFQQIAQKERAH